MPEELMCRETPNSEADKQTTITLSIYNFETGE